jgi:hypothetical protein
MYFTFIIFPSQRAAVDGVVNMCVSCLADFAIFSDLLTCRSRTFLNFALNFLLRRLQKATSFAAIAKCSFEIFPRFVDGTLFVRLVIALFENVGDDLVNISIFFYIVKLGDHRLSLSILNFFLIRLLISCLLVLPFSLHILVVGRPLLLLISGVFSILPLGMLMCALVKCDPRP